MGEAERWWEDFAPGQVAEFGDYAMTEAEILEFARRYDPQPFHTDHEAARDTIFGGLIASGWNTVGATMSLLVRHLIPRNASLGSPGVDEVRWLRPVRPGDRLSVRATVLDVVASRSKPDRGIVRSLIETRNQRQEVVMTMRALALYRRRPSDEERA